MGTIRVQIDRIAIKVPSGAAPGKGDTGLRGAKDLNGTWGLRVCKLTMINYNVDNDDNDNDHHDGIMTVASFPRNLLQGND